MNAAFFAGDLATGTEDRPTRVWGLDLKHSVDSIDQNEIALVIEGSDKQGWIRVMTPRGVTGLVHRNNLQKTPGANHNLDEVR